LNATALEYQFSKARRNEQEYRRNRFENFVILGDKKYKITWIFISPRYRMFRPLVLPIRQMFGWGQVWSTSGM